jgi:hypothetical protein
MGMDFREEIRSAEPVPEPEPTPEVTPADFSRNESPTSPAPSKPDSGPEPTESKEQQEQQEQQEQENKGWAGMIVAAIVIAVIYLRNQNRSDGNQIPYPEQANIGRDPNDRF